jgi:hyperosmotically inducible protein
MLKRLQLFVRLLMVLGVMAGCQAITGETAGQNIDDTTITTTVKAKLAADKGSSLTRVQVDTNRGVVQLTGVVQSTSDRTHAAEVARSVSGVRQVVNNLQVQ